MKLWYHPESDSIFWDEFCDDALCEDVTGDRRFHEAARERGVVKPIDMTSYGYDTPQLPPSTGFAAAVISSYKKWHRKPADLYPTPVDGTESIIEVLKAMKRPDGTPIKRIWEPACGDGRLARVLEWHGFEVVSTDLREYPGYGIGGLDFLCDNPEEKWGWDIGEIDAIVTNPPFSLAEEFIRRALSITPNVVMLLKQTYWNVGGRSKGLWEDHTPDMELKLTWRLAFLATERGNSPLMDCMWVIWNGGNVIAVEEFGPLTSHRHCIAEPIQRKKYPGYSGIGVLAATQVLEGEMFDLGETIRKLLPTEDEVDI